MNIAFKKLFPALVCAAVVLTGCTKKPVRPDPTATILGPQTGGSSIATSDVPLAADLNTGLEQRPPGVIETDDMIRGLLQPVYFDFDRFNIKESERVKLQEGAKYLKDHPEHRLLLEGHCDWRGTAEYNLGLGDRRAVAAKQYLTSIGVSGDKAETLSKGALEAAKNGDDAATAKDRRVEIVILKK